MEQMHIAHSEALYDRAKELMPGGVNSPVRAFQSVGGTPRFIQRAKDQYLYDEDGNVYIDYIGSWGPMILGHNPDIVLEAVRNQLENGLSYGAATALEVEMAELIHQIIRETGCEKVNVIAHSKGGLDMRAALALTDIAPYVASLTTINTPHRGCQFADYLLGKIPGKQQQMVANTYNAGAAKLGDINPDFLAAVYDLTSEKCSEFNNEIKDNPDIYYQSVGSKLNHPASGRFPLNFTYPLVKYFDGPNDGLVGEESFRWGQNYQFLTVSGKRGISHGDMIDLNRENIKGFDVREFYVQVVAGLKKMGF